VVDGVSSIGSSIGTYRSLAGTARKSGGGAGASSADATDGANATGTATGVQTPQAQQQVQKLKQSDANVRKHEAAHQAAGGGNAGAASFTYTRGPDGKSYATAGEVQVDISPESEPSATISKMEQVKAAALAPDDPSPQDLRVAAQADALKLKAQSELRQQGGSAGAGKDDGKSGDSGASRGDAANGDNKNASASPALSARGAAAYGSALNLVGATAAFGAARGASFVV
jgi:hypothetical protein